uniref:General transcription and DNA repair factor IIH subunit TFB5 n=1 Tax=Ditylenchus dipsaci TaxID=166011 RepID=A0A915DBS3_9BILA
MVNVQKGTIIKCDSAMKQYLKFVDEQRMLGRSFILKDLDETHVFVDQGILSMLEDRIDSFMDQLTPDQQESK